MNYHKGYGTMGDTRTARFVRIAGRRVKRAISPA